MSHDQLFGGCFFFFNCGNETHITRLQHSQRKRANDGVAFMLIRANITAPPNDFVYRRIEMDLHSIRIKAAHEMNNAVQASKDSKWRVAGNFVARLLSGRE